MFILNDAQLNAILLRDFKDMVDELTPKFLTKLEEFIQTLVYDAGTPNWYQRQGYSGGFIGSWTASNANIVLQTIHSMIDNNPNLMVHDPDSFIHGSNYWSTDDVRDILAEIIDEGKSGPLFGQGYWRQPRQFMEAMESFLNTPQANALFESIMTSRGLVWIKI